MNSRAIHSILFFLLITVFCDAKGNKTFFVADRKAPCAGTFECIQIREKTKDQWRVFSDTIEGFSYEEGYEYKISVQPLQTLNTQSGIYEEKYKLLKVISKRKTDYNPTQKLFEKKWVLKSMFDAKNTFRMNDTAIFIRFSLNDGRAAGRGSCNSFTASFTSDDSKISITGLAATKMLCKGEQLENILFKFYKNTTTYKIAGNYLTLYQPDGSDLKFEGR